METKTCTKCKISRPLEQFSNDKSKQDGKRPSCRVCKATSDKAYKANNRDKVREKDKKYYQDNKEAIQQKVKAWCEANPERKQEQRRTWYDNNQDKVKTSRAKSMAKLYAKNPGYMNEYIKKRYKDDMNYRIKSILCARIRSVVKTKSSHTLEILGLPLDLFIKWIEYQFDDAMCWENHGTYWHFDHVRPCASFDLENSVEMYRCFNWTNIRPLEKIDNIKKGDKVCEETISSHNRIMRNFKNIVDVPSCNRNITMAD